MDTITAVTQLILAAFIMGPAVASDIRQRRIPNWLCLLGFFAGITLHGWLGGWSGAGFALASGLVLLLCMFSLFVIGWLGAGDVKLLAAAGAIGGSLNTALIIVLATAIVGGVLGVSLLIHRRIRIRTQSSGGTRNPDAVIGSSAHAQTIPYAVAIAIGTLMAMTFPLL